MENNKYTKVIETFIAIAVFLSFVYTVNLLVKNISSETSKTFEVIYEEEIKDNPNIPNIHTDNKIIEQPTETITEPEQVSEEKEHPQYPELWILIIPTLIFFSSFLYGLITTKESYNTKDQNKYVEICKALISKIRDYFRLKNKEKELRLIKSLKLINTYELDSFDDFLTKHNKIRK